MTSAGSSLMGISVAVTASVTDITLQSVVLWRRWYKLGYVSPFPDNTNTTLTSIKTLG